MLFHIGNHIAHGVEIFDLLVRDLDPELIRQMCIRDRFKDATAALVVYSIGS